MSDANPDSRDACGVIPASSASPQPALYLALGGVCTYSTFALIMRYRVLTYLCLHRQKRGILLRGQAEYFVARVCFSRSAGIEILYRRVSSVSSGSVLVPS